MICTDKTSKDLNKLCKENETVVFNIHTPGCGACEMNFAELEKLCHENPKLVVVKSNVENEAEYMKENNIQKTPQTCIYHNGEKVFSHNGFISKEQLEEELKKCGCSCLESCKA